MVHLQGILLSSFNPNNNQFFLVSRLKLLVEETWKLPYRAIAITTNFKRIALTACFLQWTLSILVQVFISLSVLVVCSSHNKPLTNMAFYQKKINTPPFPQTLQRRAPAFGIKDWNMFVYTLWAVIPSHMDVCKHWQDRRLLENRFLFRWLARPDGALFKSESLSWSRPSYACKINTRINRILLSSRLPGELRFIWGTLRLNRCFNFLITIVL